MAQFDESKVINTLHADKAEVGKKYLHADNIFDLKNRIEHDDYSVGILAEISDGLFKIGVSNWYLLYPYEELPKKRMTNIQLMEWLNKGNGIAKHNVYNSCFYHKTCGEDDLNDKVDEDIVIRTWDSEEWVAPTVDIYERDCKGVKE